MKPLRILLAAACLVAATAAEADSSEWTKEEEAAVNRVDDYLDRQGLLKPRKDRCRTKVIRMVEFTTETEIVVGVRCSGEEFNPIMFRVSVDRKTGALSWDRGHFDDYRPVPKKVR